MQLLFLLSPPYSIYNQIRHLCLETSAGIAVVFIGRHMDKFLMNIQFFQMNILCMFRATER